MHPTSSFFDKKKDQGKDPWYLLDLRVVSQVAKVLAFGMKKYSANSWQDVPDAKNRYFSAAMRHFQAYQAGEKKDEESGLHPLAHAACDIFFLLAFELGYVTTIEDRKNDRFEVRLSYDPGVIIPKDPFFDHWSDKL